MSPPAVTKLFLIDSLLAGQGAVFFDALKHLVLPSVSLGAGVAAIVARVLRSSMLEILRQDYITLARAKGQMEFLVVMKHALRNALIPTVTVVGLQVGVLLGGNMIVETVFSWPGLGRLVVKAIFDRDFPLVHFGDSGLVIGALPAELDLHLASRIMRERYGVLISLVHAEGGELMVLGTDDVAGRRAIDVGAMADHLFQKFDWIDSRSDMDHVARFRLRDLLADPGRLEEVVREIGLGRAILEG